MVAEGVFPALVRSMPTEIRGRVTIAARRYDQLALTDGKPPDKKEFPQPGIIGSVEIQDCEKISPESVAAELKRRFGPEFAEFYPRHYFPERSSVYLWSLKKPRLLARIRPLKLENRRRVLLRYKLDLNCELHGSYM